MTAVLLALALAQASLVERLASDDVAERTSAERELRAMGRAALPILERASRDPDPEVAGRARRLFHLIPALERVSPALRRAVPDIEGRLESGDPRAWAGILQAAVPDEPDLAQAYPPFPVPAADLTPIVGLALDHARAEERDDVSDRILRSWGRGAPVDHLVGALSNPSLRVFAMVALGERAARSAVPALLGLVEDPAVGHLALGTLADLGAREAVPHLLRALAADPSPWRVEMLGDLQAREAVPALALLLRDDRDDLREATIRALEEMGAPAAAAVLVERLDGLRPDLRARMLESLRLRSPERAAVPARRFLRDPSPRVRETALWAVLAARDREALPEVLRLLDDPDPRNRMIAARAAGEGGAREAVPALLEAIADPDVKGSALHALGRMAAADAIPAFLLFLSDEDPWIRARAVEGLAAARHAPALPAIESMLEDREHQVRVAAAEAVLDLSGPDLVPFLAHGDFQLRGAAVRRLARRRDPAGVEAILPVLAHERPEVRRAAVEALLHTPHREVLPRLPLEDPDAEVRRAAVGILLRFSGEEDRARVAALLRDPMPDVRSAAADWLCERGFRDGVPVLLREHGEVFLLNAVRRPAVWRRLEGRTMRRTGWSMDLSRAALETGLPLEFPHGRQRDPNKKILYGGADESAPVLWALREALAGNNDAVIEEDRIVVLPSGLARDFWEKWWEGESKK